MNCDEVEELIGAYVLRALPSESLADIGEHLATCGNHPDTAELQTVASSLTFAAPELEPPASLRARLMEAVHLEAGDPGVAQERSQVFRHFLRLMARPAFSYSVVGALAVAVLVLVVTNLTGTGTDRQVAAFAGSGCSGGRLTREDGILVLEVQGLAPLEEDEVYQIWGLQQNRPGSLGLLGTAPGGQALAAIYAHTSKVDQIALTVEPAGGSIAPTSEPLCAADSPDAG